MPAFLAENSPSCGSSTIYDGSFTGITIPGTGVTAALLEKNGVKVFNQQALVVESGIPYRKLMSSVLHHYVSGYLIEKTERNKLK